MLSNLGLIVKDKAMKHLIRFISLAVFICACNLFTSCEDDGWQSFNNNDKYVGEWRPVRYATTYGEEVLTDEDEIDKYWDFGWLILSENSYKSATTPIYGNYLPQDNKITFYYYGGTHSEAYDVFSFDKDELVLTDSDSHTEIITLRKFQERSIDTQDIVGKWRARKLIIYDKNGNLSFNDFERLNGWEYINITYYDITLLGKNRNCLYYISNNNLYTTPNLSEFDIASMHIKDVNDSKLYIQYVSLDKKSEMYVTYTLIEEY